MLTRQKPQLGQLPDYTRFPWPVALWPFIKAGNLIDLSGNRIAGTITNAVWKAGEFGPVLAFDGTGDYVQATKPSCIAQDKPITAVIRVKNLDAVNLRAILNIQGAVGDQLKQVLCIYFMDGGSIIRVSHRQNSGMGRESNSFTTTNWNQIAITNTGAGAPSDIYINGKLENAGINVTLSDFGGDVIQIAKGVTATYDGKCEVDYCIIFDRVLTASQIAQLSSYDPFPWFEEDPVSHLYVPGAPPTVKPAWYYNQMTAMMRRSA